MIIETTRFGQRVIEEDNIIDFSSGLLAFADLKRFILFDVAENPQFKWLQSIDDPGVAFLMVDPFKVKKDYCVDLSDQLVEDLAILSPADVLILTTVTVPKSGFQQSTTNLIGPVIINWPRKKAKQIICDNKELSTRYRLFSDAYRKFSYGG